MYLHAPKCRLIQATSRKHDDSPSELQVPHFLTNPYAGGGILQVTNWVDTCQNLGRPALASTSWRTSGIGKTTRICSRSVRQRLFGFTFHIMSSYFIQKWDYQIIIYHRSWVWIISVISVISHIQLSSSGYGPQRLNQALGERLWREWSVRSPERSKDCFSTTNNNNNISQLSVCRRARYQSRCLSRVK